MHIAVNNGSKNIICMLINNDINPDQKNKDNMTPLELAQSKHSDTDIYAYLSNILAEKKKKNVKKSKINIKINLFIK